MLPRYIAVAKSEYDYFMILETDQLDDQKDGKRIYKIHPRLNVEYSLDNCESSFVLPSGLGFRTDKLYIRRNTDREPYYNDIEITPLFASKILTLTWGRSNETVTVPVIDIHQQRGNKNQIWGSRYTAHTSKWFVGWKLHTNENALRFLFPTIDGDYVWTYSQEGMRRLNKRDVLDTWREPAHPPQPRVQTMLPSHVLQGFMESFLLKKEVCPISMDELTRATICMTPCYHILKKECAVEWIDENDTCPICRTECKVDSLVFMK
jgi:hypothetical protein